MQWVKDNGIGGGMFNTNNSAPVLVNVTFNGNSTDSSGGGMYNRDSNPELNIVTFLSNSASTQGGGMYNHTNSIPVLIDVAFITNTAGAGGGMTNSVDSAPVLTNVSFTGNSAPWVSGMYNIGDSAPELTNVTFTGNSADEQGGGMRNSNSSAPVLTNVTFTNNTADTGGGMYNSNSTTPVLINTILWGNTASVSGHQIYNVTDATLTVTLSHSLYANGGNDIVNDGPGTVTISEVNSIHDDPQFLSTDPVDADFLRLSPNSPAINAGDPATDLSLFPQDAGGTPLDLAGNPRVFPGVIENIDIGAYEFQDNPAGTIVPDENNILYVNQNVAGGNQSGDSWANALPELRDALAWAADEWDGSNGTLQVWVAQGLYTPVEPADPANVTDEERQATFQLVNNVEVYGGFSALGTQTSLNQRDWEANGRRPTLLAWPPRSPTMSRAAPVRSCSWRTTRRRHAP